MRRRDSIPIIPFDSEIEATARRRNAENRKKKKQKQANMSILEQSAPKVVLNSSIKRPAVDANNFEIKTSFIQFIQQNQFAGAPTDNPNDHLNQFLENCDNLKINGVTDDAIRLRLFPHSLRGRAKEWLRSCDADSFDTWEKLSTSFLQKFFPPRKTTKLRNDITGFVQLEHESFYDAWEQYKDL